LNKPPGLALLAAISPPAVLVAALYLASAQPGRTTAFYVAGGFVAVAVVGTAALIAIRAGGLSVPSHHQTRYGLRLGLGVLACAAAVLIWRHKPAAARASGRVRVRQAEEAGRCPTAHRQVATIGVLIGVVFLIASASEILLVSARASWAWLHILMSVLFIGAAVWAFVRPFGAFWALASVVRLLLILRGSLDLVTSINPGRCRTAGTGRLSAAAAGEAADGRLAPCPDGAARSVPAALPAGS
jgi:hypothetical protein